MSNERILPPAQEHYPYLTRALLRLYNEGFLPNVASVDVEPDYGRTSRLTYTDGRHRFIYGNDLGLNSGAAEKFANDKGYSKFLLRAIGVDCPAGAEFLLPWWADAIRDSQQRRGNSNMRTADEAHSYVDSNLGYPVYVKPVTGSLGNGVVRVDEPRELLVALDELNERKSRVAVVEQAIGMPDFRVVVFDGQLICAYERVPLSIVGDGVSSVTDLLALKQKELIESGRSIIFRPEDPRVKAKLSKAGLTEASVVAEGESLRVADISNLSAGGTAVDLTTSIHERWVNIASNVADEFSLRLCGIDLACEDPTTGGGEYSVIEVNATPGLDHYAASGDEQAQIVDNLYTKALNEFPQLSN